MAKREVTEKTGEINVCGQLLRHAQRTHRGAYWLGTSTRAEARLAYDAALAAGAFAVAFLQFKAANRRRGKIAFQINGQQFLTLAGRSRRYPHSTFYALPAFRLQKQLMTAAPGFLRWTCFVDVESMTAFPATGANFHVLLDPALAEDTTQPAFRRIVLDGQPHVSAPCVGWSGLVQSLSDIGGSFDRDQPQEVSIFEPLRGVRQPAMLVLP